MKIKNIIVYTMNSIKIIKVVFLYLISKLMDTGTKCRRQVNWFSTTGQHAWAELGNRRNESTLSDRIVSDNLCFATFKECFCWPSWPNQFQPILALSFFISAVIPYLHIWLSRMKQWASYISTYQD